jgi:hypothetical protein
LDKRGASNLAEQQVRNAPPHREPEVVTAGSASLACHPQIFLLVSTERIALVTCKHNRLAIKLPLTRQDWLSFRLIISSLVCLVQTTSTRLRETLRGKATKASIFLKELIASHDCQVTVDV